MIDARVIDLILLPPIASAISPYPPPYLARHFSSKWKARQEINEIMTNVTREKANPPFLNAFGRNSTPVPMNDLIKRKNVLVKLAFPGLLALVDFRLPSRGLLSPSPSPEINRSSSSLSTAVSSSDSARSSPANEP